MGKNLTTQNGLKGLVTLVKRLRGENGCPWDRAQTPEKIKVYLIEEAYEVLDAIDSEDAEEVCSELGDLLFHIVFLAQLFDESGTFNMNRVIRGIQEKMMRRHPHVFGDSNVSDVGGVKSQWQHIKESEMKRGDSGLFDSVPVALPAMLRAYRLGERAARIGLDNRGLDEGWQDVENAYKDLSRESTNDDEKTRSKCFGELLFSLIQVGRMMDIHPENALSQVLARFLKRCRYVERFVRESGQTIGSLSEKEISRLWEASKKTQDTS